MRWLIETMIGTIGLSDFSSLIMSLIFSYYLARQLIFLQAHLGSKAEQRLVNRSSAEKWKSKN